MTSSESYHHKADLINPDWVLGYTTRNHLCIDLDNTSYPKVLGLVQMIMKYYPYVGHACIMLSSTRKFKQQINYTPPNGLRVQTVRNNYHVIFDNFISYEASCKIIETLAHLDVIDKEYIRIREMRNDMTLRTNKTVLTTGIKDAPKFLCWIKNIHERKKGYGIDQYLRFYLVSNFL